jgi:proteasome lid subunit RPN8/RPN11
VLGWVEAHRLLGRPDFFLADPYEQYRAETALRDSGLELLGVYHSHPGGGTLPSPLDLEFAAKRDIAHVVVALHSGGSTPTELAAYRMRNGQLVPLPVVITD